MSIKLTNRSERKEVQKRTMAKKYAHISTEKQQLNSSEGGGEGERTTVTDKKTKETIHATNKQRGNWNHNNNFN